MTQRTRVASNSDFELVRLSDRKGASLSGDMNEQGGAGAIGRAGHG